MEQNFVFAPEDLLFGTCLDTVSYPVSKEKINMLEGEIIYI